MAPFKSKRLIFFTSLVHLVASSAVSVTWYKKQSSVTTFVYCCLYTPFMIVFIIVAVISYFYIVQKTVSILFTNQYFQINIQMDVFLLVEVSINIFISFYIFIYFVLFFLILYHVGEICCNLFKRNVSSILVCSFDDMA